MGQAVERDRFEEEEFDRFGGRLERSLEALAALLERPGFGAGPQSVGAEVELFLVDGAARPLPANRAVLEDARDARVQPELDRFDLECNLRPTPLAGRPFAFLDAEMADAFGAVARAAARRGGRPVWIGILPTLREADLQPGSMSDVPRFRALSAGLRRIGGGPFRVHIEGTDSLRIECEDLTFEGANSSLQLHLRAPPERFAATYNAAQLASAPALAVAGNSPTFLGRRLWEETRVALFKQSVDARAPSSGRRRGVPRVSFGSGWASGPLELFAESVELHPPLIPLLSDEDPLEVLRAGGLPRLDELRLHQGTVWRWNRAIYDPAEEGHLRLELRALPSGPTRVDMLANAAFLIGLTLGLAPEAEGWVRGVPFEQARTSFYRAAQHGLAAEIAWPPEPGAPPEPVPAKELVPRLLSTARAGLEAGGVAPAEVATLLGVVEARATSGRTSAAWQRETLEALEPGPPGEATLARLLERYLANVASEEPVHRWPAER